MILAWGAKGTGFDSRTGLVSCFLVTIAIKAVRSNKVNLVVVAEIMINFVTQLLY